MDVSNDKEQELAYYDAEFERRFSKFTHPYTHKNITSVQDYLDALESSQLNRSVVTQRKLSLDELQEIFAEKFKGCINVRTGQKVRSIGDFLEAIDEQKRQNWIKEAKEKQKEIAEREEVVARTQALAKEAEAKEKEKIAELKKQERKFLRKQRNEKIIAVILAIVGIVVGALGWLFSAAAFGWCFRFLEQFPIISSILYFPSDIGMVTLTTVNTFPYLCGGTIAEKVGKPIARKIYAWIFLALNVASIVMPLFMGQLGIKTLFIGVLGAGSCYLLTKDN